MRSARWASHPCLQHLLGSRITYMHNANDRHVEACFTGQVEQPIPFGEVTTSKVRKQYPTHLCHPWLQVLRLGCEISSAMAHLHSLNIVHRDLKPGNVLISAGGGRDCRVHTESSLSSGSSDCQGNWGWKDACRPPCTPFAAPGVCACLPSRSKGGRRTCATCAASIAGAL
jgi:serine/threonine protein kinase